MKNNKTFAFVSVSIAVVLAGCTLDPPREFGQSCEKIQFIWANGEAPVTPEQNKGYKFYFNNHVCPPNAPFCMTMIGDQIDDEVLENMHFCSDRRESCPTDAHSSSHPSGGSCKRDTPKSCGIHEENCENDANGVEKAYCADMPGGKECQPISCLESFALLDNACKSGNQCCGDYCKNCPQTEASHLCYPLEDGVTMECGNPCPDYASLACNGVCVDPMSSLTFCGSTDCQMHRCSNEPGWRSGNCIKGKCQASSCITGYHLVKGDPDYCEADTTEICGNQMRNCNAIAKSTATGCVAGHCRALECENGLYAYDDSCIEIQVVQCGAVQCRPHQICNPETLTCDCEPGYTDCYGDCFDLTSNAYHCGGCNTICQRQIPNGQNQCTNSTCTYKCDSGYQYDETTKSCEQQAITCHTGYHPNGSECEPDSLENCGKHGRSCDVENAQNTCNQGKCEFECDPGYHKDENRCAPDSVDGCTDGETRCDENNSPQICEGGAWNACSPHICDEDMCIECANNQHIYDGACEDNSIEHCGSHETQCSAPAHGTAICTNATCDFTCDGDYTKSGSICIESSSYCASSNATRCVNSGTSGKMQKCTDNKWIDQEPCSSSHSCNSSGTACGECTDNSKQCSGRTPQICTKGAWQANGSCTDAQICKDGSCQKCGSDQHVYNNTCENNSLSNCGKHDYACNAPSNGSATCSGGKCEFDCDPGYIVNGSNCVPDDNYCPTNNKRRCVDIGYVGQIEKCVNNSWIYQYECDDDASCMTSTSCGECQNGTTDCSGSMTIICDEGEWYNDASCLKKCIKYSSGVKKENGVCVATACSSGFSVGITGESCVSSSDIQYDGCESYEAATPHSTFYDISDSHWGAAAAQALLNYGITSGCGTAGGQPQFCPDCSIKRWEAAIFLKRALELSDYTPSTDSFSDVSIDMVLEKQSAATSAAAYKAIERLVKNGYIPKGMDKFNPEAALTRAEGAALLVRAFDMTQTPPSTPSFPDVPQSHWAYKYVEALKNQCMISGIDTGGGNYIFSPDEQMTRIQFGLILARLSCYVSSCEWCI